MPPNAVESALQPLLARYREDRETLPLWTYQAVAWDEYSVPWFVRVMWSPRVRARSLVGQSSGFWRYLENTQIDGRPVKWIEVFGPWTEVTVKLGRRDGKTTGEATVAMPQLLQAHVAGLYAATGDRVPDEVKRIALPERPDSSDVEAFLADARRSLDRLYSELEGVIAGDPGLLHQLRQDFDRRIAQGKWWREWLEAARELSDPEERSPEAEYHLRRELEQPELVSELLERMTAWPSLRGDRKIPMNGDPLLQLYREALELVERFRAWRPDCDRIVDLIDLITEDPAWHVTASFKNELLVWQERLRRGSLPRAHETRGGDERSPAVSTMPERPVPEAVFQYARWLRFPYLPSPEPGPLAEPEGRIRKRAARWLVRTTLPGGPIADATLQNYLSRAR